MENVNFWINKSFWRFEFFMPRNNHVLDLIPEVMFSKKDFKLFAIEICISTQEEFEKTPKEYF